MSTDLDTPLGTVVICAALDVEYAAVREHLTGPFTEREERGTLYEIATFPTDHGRWTVALAQTGAGNTQAGVQLERAVSVFGPQIVLFVGVAGGRKDVALGDVVIADHIYDYESGKDTGADYLPRIKTAAPSYRLVERAKMLARQGSWQHRIQPPTPKPTPKALVKPMAAGGKVVADQRSATAQFLNRHCGDAVALEMEGHGFLHGAYVNAGVDALVVRGISDLLSEKTETADEHWQPTASRHAAAFAFELLTRLEPPSGTPRTMPAMAAVPPRQLPPAPPHFVGRTDELAHLTTALGTNTADTANPGGMVLISALAGAGGIGKTWLALNWANRRIGWFPDGQLFVDLRGFSPDRDPMPSAAAVRGFLDALGVDPARIPDDLHAKAALFRSLVADRRMLIVLDNAADADQVAPLLPGGQACTVLVTSRRTLNTLISRHGAHHLRLDPLSTQEAHSLLTRRLGVARMAAEPAAVRELVEFCRGFPLALGILAARAHTHPEIPLAEFAMDLRELGLSALEDDDPTASLPAVLSWSYTALTAEQQTVFGLLGIAPGPDIGLPAAASLTALTPTRAGRVLRALEEASLLTRDANGRYSMHDLIRDYATDTVHHLAEGVREAALRRVVDFYLHTANTADRLLNPHTQPIQLDPPAPGAHPHPLPDAPASLAWFDIEHPNLLAAQHTATTQERHKAVWQLAWTLGTFNDRHGHRHDDLAVWRAALAAARHLSDPATHTLALRFLGRSYTRVGRHDEATGYLHQALALAEHHHDPTQQAHTHYELALAWERRGDDRPALEHATHALLLYRTLDHPAWEADALNQVGWYAARLGDYNRARTHCQDALALFQRHRYPNGEANTLDSLGYIDHHTGHHHQAIHHYQQALTLYRDLGNTSESANTLDNLGHPHAALGQHDQARTVWREALELYRQQARDDNATRVQGQLDDLDKPASITGSHK